MKKVTNYLLMFFMSAIVLFVTSCGDDGEILPIGGASISEIQVDGADTSSITRAPGEAVTVGIAYDLDDATDITLTAMLDYNDSTVSGPTPLSSTSPNPVQVTFTVPSSATETFTVTYELRDADGNSVDSQDLEVVIEEDVDATTYEAVLLAAPVGQNPGERTSATFFSAIDGETYSVEDVVAGTDVTSENIHFGYYYGASNAASIASPAEYPTNVYDLTADGAGWDVLNETEFREITSSDFDTAITSDEVASLFEAPSTSVQEINGLAVGDTYAFSYVQGEDTYYGAFRVDELQAGFDSNDYITITVKTQTVTE